MRAERIGAWGAMVIALVAPARLYLQARSLVDVTDPVLPMMSNVLRTTWGRGWLLQLIASAAVLAGLLLASRRIRGAWALALPATVLLALSPALMGHAVAADRYLLVSIGSDCLHVIAAGMWVGALSILMIVITSKPPWGPNDASASGLIAAFHPVALTSGGALIVSGVTSLLLRVNRVGELVHSSYGAILAGTAPPMPDVPGMKMN